MRVLLGLLGLLLLLCGLFAIMAYGDHYDNDRPSIAIYANDTLHPQEHYPLLNNESINPGVEPLIDIEFKYVETYEEDIKDIVVYVVPNNVYELTDESINYWYKSEVIYPHNNPGNTTWGYVFDSNTKEFEFTYQHLHENSTHMYIQGFLVADYDNSHHHWGLVRDHVTYEEYVERVSPWQFNLPENQSSKEYKTAKELNEMMREYNNKVDKYHDKLEIIEKLISELELFEKHNLIPKIEPINKYVEVLDSMNGNFSSVADIDLSYRMIDCLNEIENKNSTKEVDIKNE